jgi:hypothetical protein
MEEILASIRRIIADDQDRVPRPSLDAQFREPLSPDPDIAADRPLSTYPSDEFDGEEPTSTPTADLLTTSSPMGSFQEEAREPTHSAAEPAPMSLPAPELIAASPSRKAAPPAFETDPRAFVSEAVGAHVADSFSRLSNTLHPPGPARTMEEHVTEMLRPMLKAWLDENLPALVERLVEAEIERIARRGR